LQAWHQNLGVDGCAWRHNYESPFRNWKEQASFLIPELCKLEGVYWAIPSDGRIPFKLNPKGLHLKSYSYGENHEDDENQHGQRKSPQNKAPADVQRIGKFYEILSQSHHDRSFSVSDWDP
jgi:hypothetical protein